MSEPEREVRAIFARIADAVNGAKYGEAVTIVCPPAMPIRRAVAFAEQLREIARIEEDVRITSDGQRLLIEPSTKTAPVRRPAPKRGERRRGVDRRVAERRRATPDGAVSQAPERRSGRDRRSGLDRRRSSVAA